MHVVLRESALRHCHESLKEHPEDDFVDNLRSSRIQRRDVSGDRDTVGRRHDDIACALVVEEVLNWRCRREDFCRFDSSPPRRRLRCSQSVWLRVHRSERDLRIGTRSCARASRRHSCAMAAPCFRTRSRSQLDASVEKVGNGIALGTRLAQGSRRPSGRRPRAAVGDLESWHSLDARGMPQPFGAE